MKPEDLTDFQSEYIGYLRMSVRLHEKLIANEKISPLLYTEISKTINETIEELYATIYEQEKIIITAKKLIKK